MKLLLLTAVLGLSVAAGNLLADGAGCPASKSCGQAQAKKECPQKGSATVEAKKDVKSAGKEEGGCPEGGCCKKGDKKAK